MKQLVTIGRAEMVDLPGIGIFNVPAKVDTGADLCAIWAHKTTITSEGLDCVFFGPKSEYYDGVTHHFPQKNYTVTRIVNSFGERELRNKVKLQIRIKGRLISGTFTLSDRSQKLYPILIGRRLLKNKFLVDVSEGQVLHDEEHQRSKNLKQELSRLQKGLE
jgi:hypothetical protein